MYAHLEDVSTDIGETARILAHQL